MQDIQCYQELSDQDLEAVVGGSHHGHLSWASTSVTIGTSASAQGGKYNIDLVFTTAESFTWTNGQGESVSVGFGFAVAVAL